MVRFANDSHTVDATARSSALLSHTLVLARWTGAEANVCPLLSACPSLQVCVLDFFLFPLSVGMLNALSSSCPLLTHLQLSVGGEFAPPDTATTVEALSPPPSPFRSLVHFDLHYMSWSRSSAHISSLVMTTVQSFIAGSPLQQLRLTLHFKVYYQPALTPWLLTLPKLERLQVTVGEWQLIHAAQQSTAWEDDLDDDVDEKQAGHTAATPPPPSAALASSEPALPAAAPPATSAASSASSASSLRSLDLRVSSALLPVEHLAALLSHCPAVTSIRLTVHAQDGLLLLFLHCLGCIGLHCPLIEDVTFELDPPGMPTRMHVAALSVDEVRAVVDACQLPAGAFGALRCVCEVGDVVQALSAEAASYVRRRWLSGVRGVPVLD